MRPSLLTLAAALVVALGLRLVAFASQSVTDATAAQRGKQVEEAIRAQAGGSPRMVQRTSA